MLFSPDGKQIRSLPDAAEFKRAVRLLGANRAKAIRLALKRLIDDIPPESRIGARTFNTSRIASQLQPWPYPLASLYDIALEIEGKEAIGRQVYDRAWLIFGLFVWECIMKRKEKWVIGNQSSPSAASTQEITKQIYIEQRPHKYMTT